VDGSDSEYAEESMIAGFDRGLLNQTLFRCRKHALLGLLPAMAMMLSVACNDQKPAPAVPMPVASGAPPQNSTSAMFKKLKQNERPLPPAPVEDLRDSGVPVSMPALVDDFEMSPECKALVVDRGTIRKAIEKHVNTVVAKASQELEKAYDNYMDCQDDPGCLNDIRQFEARQTGYQRARRAESKSEEYQEELETRLYGISQKFAAKCDTNPL